MDQSRKIQFELLLLVQTVFRTDSPIADFFPNRYQSYIWKWAAIEKYKDNWVVAAKNINKRSELFPSTFIAFKGL